MIDNTLLKKGAHVWHKSPTKKGIVQPSGIDVDALRGDSHIKRHVFGYKLHLPSITITRGIVVHLTANVTIANLQDNPMYISLIPFSWYSFY